MLRAIYNLPSSSSMRAAAIQPFGFFGLILITFLIKIRAFLKSPISASVLIGTDAKSVK